MPQCQNCQKEFTIYPEDREFYQKIEVPEPTWCPDCCLMRRLAFRNERNLYQRKCDATGKTIISLFQVDSPYKVYEPDYWWSDKWEPLEYGRDYDFSRGFFEQIEELFRQVPRAGVLSMRGAVNCDYCSSTLGKNCYLCFLWYGNDCLYCTWGLNVNDSVDLLHTEMCEICYQLTDARRCYNVKFSHQCYDCWDSAFLFDCRNCHDCFGGVNLRNTSYVFWGEKLSKEEYEQRLKTIDLGDYEQLEKYNQKYQEFKKQAIYRNLEYLKSINCHHCEYVDGCKNCYECFDLWRVEDSRYVYNSGECREAVNSSYFGMNSELAYECIGGGTGAYNLKFCETVRGSANMEYCAFCHNCHDCLACSGLQNKKYCLLNKQYGKKEYKELAEKIKKQAREQGEYGQFFPLRMALYPYNDSYAHVLFPKTQEEVVTMGGWWQDFQEKKEYSNQILTQDLPNHIREVSDDILDRTIICAESGRGFKIIKQELDFYQKHNLPLPRFHPEVRHQHRLNQRRARQFFKRKCSRCGKIVESTIAVADPRRVYCEDCYQKEIY